MTPERAAELAHKFLQISNHGLLLEVQQAILAACAEQREADATKCDELARTYEYPAFLCAKAIRSGA